MNAPLPPRKKQLFRPVPTGRGRCGHSNPGFHPGLFSLSPSGRYDGGTTSCIRSRIGGAGGRLIRDRIGSKRRLASGDAHSSSKRRSMNGAQFHLPRVCFAGGGLKGNNHFVPSLQDGGQCGVLGPRVPPGAILTISLREMRPCDHEFRSFEGRRRRWTTVTKQQQFGHPGHLPELN
jgi:hypothetical protein